jgi:hypothetical protein
MRYWVQGADSRTGSDVSSVIEADGVEAAQKKAKAMGIFISSVTADDAPISGVGFPAIAALETHGLRLAVVNPSTARYIGITRLHVYRRSTS